MAKYETTAQAKQDIARQLQEKGRQLRDISGSTDPVLKARAEQLSKDIDKLNNQMMMTGGLGAFAGGLASGVTGLLTAVPDIAIGLTNLVRGTDTKTLSERMLPGIESVSQEQAGLFGAGKGLGSSVGLTRGLAALNVGTNITDEMVFNGTPVTQLLTVAGMLTKAGASGLKNWQENRGIKKIQEQLGPEGWNNFREFMLKGQDSSDPAVAGIVAKLRSNPQYAEVFNILEKRATAKALEGTRAVTRTGYDADKAGSSVYQAIDGEVQKLKEAITKDPAAKFEAAKKMGGNNDIFMTDKTVAKLDDLITEFSQKVGKTGAGTTDANKALNFMRTMRDDLSAGRISVERMQALLGEFGAQAKQGESLIADVSLGTQKRIASAIFSGLKDDIADTASNSTVERIRSIARLVDEARDQTRKGYEAYEAFASKGLPAALKNKTLASMDTEEVMSTIKNLSNAERDRMGAILKNTAPEDLKRIRQVMYDDFIQSARTTLPDGTTGVDLKLLARKFNTLDENGQKSIAFALDVPMSDFTAKMKDAENFFKYQQNFAGKVEGKALTPAEIAEMSTAGYVFGGYGTGKAAGLMGRMWNTIKGGLSDDNMLNYLLSPEAKGILMESVKSPNATKTLEKLVRPLAGRDAQGQLLNAGEFAIRAATGPSPSEQVPGQAQPQARPALEIDETGNVMEVSPAPAQPAVAPGQRPALDLSYDPAEIEKQIRATAEKQGLGQYADMFVKQAQAESGLNPYAVSSKGASGIFQHMPATAQELGINPFDPNQSIEGGVRYMGQLLNKYQNDPTKALAAYNWGMGNVDRQGLEKMPTETQNYLSRILA